MSIACEKCNKLADKAIVVGGVVYCKECVPECRLCGKPRAATRTLCVKCARKEEEAV